MYYSIDEATARRAKDLNSFTPYEEGSATAEYQKQVNEAAEMVAWKKDHVSPFYAEKLDTLLDSYARRLASWINDYNRNNASCPSVMICGPANFPTRKKERQNARESVLWAEYEKITGILEKIKNVGIGPIDLADPHARELLQDRLDRLTARQDKYKRLNAYYRKHKTVIGFPDCSEEEAQRIQKEMEDLHERCSIYDKPAPDYELASLRDKIKRTKARLEELDRRQAEAEGPEAETEVDGVRIVRNAELNRLQLIFDGKPEEEMRSKLKSNGFRWSPRNGAWQRQLTENAEAAARRVLNV